MASHSTETFNVPCRQLSEVQSLTIKQGVVGEFPSRCTSDAEVLPKLLFPKYSQRV